MSFCDSKDTWRDLTLQRDLSYEVLMSLQFKDFLKTGNLDFKGPTK